MLMRIARVSLAVVPIAMYGLTIPSARAQTQGGGTAPIIWHFAAGG
jgi:hypothetical protein